MPRTAGGPAVFPRGHLCDPSAVQGDVDAHLTVNVNAWVVVPTVFLAVNVTTWVPRSRVSPLSVPVPLPLLWKASPKGSREADSVAVGYPVVVTVKLNTRRIVVA